MTVSSALTVCIDFAELDTWLALQPTLDLLDSLALAPEWLPLTRGLESFSTRVNKPDDDDAMAAYKARRQRARDWYSAMNRERYLAGNKLLPSQLDRPVDSTAASLALLWAGKTSADAAREIVVRLLRHWWVAGEDIDADGVSAIVDDPAFDSWCKAEGPAELDALQTDLLEQGVFMSPAYLVDGELFQGRQHLPLVGWRLGGEKGPPPV